MDSEILGGDFGIVLELRAENPSISTDSIEKWRIPRTGTAALRRSIWEDGEIDQLVTASVLATQAEVDFLRREVAILKAIVFDKMKKIEVIRVERDVESRTRLVIDIFRNPLKLVLTIVTTNVRKFLGWISRRNQLQMRLATGANSDILVGDFGILLDLLDENPRISSSEGIKTWEIPLDRINAIRQSIRKDEEIGQLTPAPVVAPQVEKNFMQRKVTILKAIVFNKMKKIEDMKVEPDSRQGEFLMRHWVSDTFWNLSQLVPQLVNQLSNGYAGRINRA